MNHHDPEQPPIVAPPVAALPPRRSRLWPWIVAGSLVVFVIVSLALAFFPGLRDHGPYHTKVYESLGREFGVSPAVVEKIDGPREGNGFAMMRAKFHDALGVKHDIIWIFANDHTITATPYSHPEFYLLWNNSNYLDGSPAESWPLPEYVAARAKMSNEVRGLADGILKNGLGER